MNKQQLDQLVKDFSRHIDNMSDEEVHQSIIESEISNDYIFTDNRGTKYQVTNAEFYAKDKNTGEILFHFPLEVSSLERE